jgi:hypothetical protein
MSTENKQIRILGICLCDRIKEAGKVQQILSGYGQIIKTRYGFHEVSEDICSRNGLIILELTGDPNEWDHFENELKEVGGIDIKNMNFTII